MHWQGRQTFAIRTDSCPMKLRVARITICLCNPPSRIVVGVVMGLSSRLWGAQCQLCVCESGTVRSQTVDGPARPCHADRLSCSYRTRLLKPQLVVARARARSAQTWMLDSALQHISQQAGLALARARRQPATSYVRVQARRCSR